MSWRSVSSLVSAQCRQLVAGAHGWESESQVHRIRDLFSSLTPILHNGDSERKARRCDGIPHDRLGDRASIAHGVSQFDGSHIAAKRICDL